MHHARSGKGPFFIEAYTYRWNSHVGPEDDAYAEYRSQDEIDFWKKNCPISLLENRMLDSGLLSSEIKRDIATRVETEISEAFDFAQNSPFPTISNWEDLNVNPGTPLADSLLLEIDPNGFNQFQADTLPEPY